ncbi:hypothetical protein, partial [Cupriavidus yeoncheonensis]|uniref:hypothetical protein n=1 Tax=Cupriavidus yeoncheonensis TaxID=1462994 RepID=UPI001BAD39E1
PILSRSPEATELPAPLIGRPGRVHSIFCPSGKSRQKLVFVVDDRLDGVKTVQGIARLPAA